jgi:hypothetical protein
MSTTFLAVACRSADKQQGQEKPAHHLKEDFTMYEYEITHIRCGMRAIIFGYDFYDACRRAKTDPKVWKIDSCEYVD